MNRHASAVRWRRAFLVGAAAVMLGQGCARNAAEAPVAAGDVVGPWHVAASTSPDPPAVGENSMAIEVRDGDGRPLRGATLNMVAYMPAMGAMPYMESRGKVREEKPGRYLISYGVSMAGDWEVTLRVRPPDGEAAEAAYRVSTNTKGVTFVSATPAPGTKAGSPAAVDSSSASPGAAAVMIDASRRQSLGIRLEAVTRRALTVPIRAAGRVAYDETQAAEVSLQYSGWVRGIEADFVGKPVRVGQTLFRAYSPELLSAQQEYLEARNTLRMDTSRVDVRELLTASRRRLERWGIGPEELRQLDRAGKATETLPVRSPVGGVVLEKSIVEGSPFSAGQVVYRISGGGGRWVLASVFPDDLPFVRAGMDAIVRGPAAAAGPAARDLRGRVTFVSPAVDPATRTGTARIEVQGIGALEPGTFVDVEMQMPLGERLAVRESAVLPTGTRLLVFVELGDGRLAPREVTLGARAGDWYEVVSGVAEGDRVVTSGNFLVASESRLRSATARWDSK